MGCFCSSTKKDSQRENYVTYKPAPINTRVDNFQNERNKNNEHPCFSLFDPIIY